MNKNNLLNYLFFKGRPPIPKINPVVPQIQPVTPGLKKCLLIGINYIDDPSNKLNGCINDVKNIKSHISKYYPNCKNYRCLTDDNTDATLKPSRKNIIDGINWLVSDLKKGENVYFHYSGHGGLMRDLNGDEKTGQDSCIYPICDGKIEFILDDELKMLLANKIPQGCKCFVVLDCCHSGSGLDLRYNINAPNYGTITITQEDKHAKTNGSVIFLSGCEDKQTSADTVDKKGLPSGAMTNALMEIWNTYGINIKFKYLLWDIRRILKTQGYTQIPQLSCGNSIDINDIFNLS
jgi:hypothetical protein